MSSLAAMPELGPSALEVKPPHPDFKEKVGLELCLSCSHPAKWAS